jgi:hypothetical protein
VKPVNLVAISTPNVLYSTVSEKASSVPCSLKERQRGVSGVKSLVAEANKRVEELSSNNGPREVQSCDDAAELQKETVVHASTRMEYFFLTKCLQYLKALILEARNLFMSWCF